MTTVDLRRRGPVPAAGVAHIDALSAALELLHEELTRLERWAVVLASTLRAGGRLLAAGNGGSAAQAQHLTSELVGRYRDERVPFSAISLHADTSSVTAIANDYGMSEMFARQVRAHGRPGDVLLALSTSGNSANVLAAVDAASAAGLHTLALTGAPPNALAAAAEDALAIGTPSTATVQEVHLVAIHLLCELFDQVVTR
jgi:D-sedoheptulose 7-phosphate isomerase